MASTSPSTSIASKIYIPHLRHNDSSYGPFDARVLAVKYPHVFTSPNTTFVPEPYIFDVVDLQPLADGRFGHIDCFLWPQLYSRKHRWSGCIFRREQFVGDDVMKWLWFTPTETDARQEPGCAFELGLLEKKLCDALEKLFNKAAGCVADAQKSVRADAQKELAVHIRAASHSLQRLRCLPLPARDMILQVAEFQRILLDTFAIVQYETIALPSRPSSDQFRLSDSKWMGVFTADPATAQELYDLCIPFWYIRLEETFPLKTNIHLVQGFVPPPSCIVTHHAKVRGELAPFPVLYRGTSGEHRHLFTRQLARVHGETYVRQHLPREPYQGMAPSVIPPNNNASTSRILPSFQRESKFASDMGSVKTKQGGAVRTAPSQPRFSPYQVPPPVDPSTGLATWHTLAPALDPFSNPPSSSSVPSTTVPITKVKGNRKPKPTLKQSEVTASSQGRDKWLDPDGDLLPPRILSWKLAMENADKAPARVHAPSVSVETWFPDPCLIAGTTSEDRRKRYLVTWLSIRSAWLNRVTASTASPVHPTIWRGFLNSILNPEQVFSSSSASSRQLNEAMDLFGPEFLKLHITAHQSPALLTWRNITVTADTLSTELIRQVLWDLAEHNFRFELLSLDKRMATAAWDGDSATRLEMVLHVFAGGAGTILGSEPFPDRNRGLGALRVEDRSPFIENFRVLLSSWPNAPSALQKPLETSAINTRVLAVERCATLFYVQSFYDTHGRPPIIPRHIPGGSSAV